MFCTFCSAPVWQFFSIHGYESWVLSLDMESKINVFATSCYRIMLGIKWQDCISNISIYFMTNTEPLVYYVRKRQLGFLGHILHLPEEELARRYAYMYHLMAKGSRVVHAPLTSSIQGVLGYHEAEISADSHICWRSMCMEKSCNPLLRSQRMMIFPSLKPSGGRLPLPPMAPPPESALQIDSY